MTTAIMIERAALDEQFQAACQRYAHGNGSSQAIAAAALRAAGAPELLEALEKRAQVDTAYARLAMSDVEHDDHERLLQQIEQAEDAAKAAGRAAIAKAKGEQA
ncbi:hypothetical protein [Bordetella petrii]|uniref:hypothetical protein n=1 Tax=Bordetella petrii TaxID=94624 RepID=UPI003730B7D7